MKEPNDAIYGAAANIKGFLRFRACWQGSSKVLLLMPGDLTKRITGVQLTLSMIFLTLILTVISSPCQNSSAKSAFEPGFQLLISI